MDTAEPPPQGGLVLVLPPSSAPRAPEGGVGYAFEENVSHPPWKDVLSSCAPKTALGLSVSVVFEICTFS